MSDRPNISDKELQDSAPLLFGMEKKRLEAPDGYFDSLADQVFSRIEEEAPVVKLKSRSSSAPFRFSIAAGLAALIGLFIVSDTGIPNTESGLQATEVNIDFEEDMDYLLAIEDEILIEIYAESEEDTDEMIDFILDEGIDYEELLNVDL